MTKIKNYKYLGLNGVLITRIELVGVEGIPMIELIADPNMILTNGERMTYSTIIKPEEINLWKEIFDPAKKN